MRFYIILLFSVLAFKSFAKDDDEKNIHIDCYEPNLNLQFFGIKDTIKYVDKKKDLTAYVVSNVAIYDITNNKINYAFKDTVKRQIIGFYFESKYIDEHKTVEFNNSYEPSETEKSGLFQHSNNRNVASRPLSNNLLIVTEDLITNNLTFWIADKYGNAIKKEIEINKDWNWEIDVKNRLVRFSKQIHHKIEINNLKY